MIRCRSIETVGLDHISKHMWRRVLGVGDSWGEFSTLLHFLIWMRVARVKFIETTPGFCSLQTVHCAVSPARKLKWKRSTINLVWCGGLEESVYINRIVNHFGPLSWNCLPQMTSRNFQWGFMLIRRGKWSSSYPLDGFLCVKLLNLAHLPQRSSNN